MAKKPIEHRFAMLFNLAPNQKPPPVYDLGWCHVGHASRVLGLGADA